ncbi:MAG: hypothetical protein AB1529_06865 [Candidatus Micrarchaeota archaeon]
MRPPERKLAGPGAEPAPAEKKRFLGRATLVSGLMVQDREPGRNPVEEQIWQSLIIKESMMFIVQGLRDKNAFEARVVGIARDILARRASAPQASAKAPENEQAPADIKEALYAALRRIGVEGEIVGERRNDSRVQFKVAIGADTYTVPLKDAIMESGDPVGEVEKIARIVSIGTTASTRREEALRKRRNSRPPAAPLQVAEEQLESRKVMYDGPAEGNNHSQFTYMVDGMESTIWAPSELKGKALLEFIDRKIFDMHLQYGKAFDAQVLEQAALEMPATKTLENIADLRVRAVAKAIYHLVCTANIEAEMVPEEYRAAFSEMRSSAIFGRFMDIRREGVLSEEDWEQFWSAFECLDHPGHKMVRAHYLKYRKEDGTLGEDEKAILSDTLRLHGGPVNSMGERALRNIADAYGLIADAEGIESWNIEALRARHFSMMYAIRKAAMAYGNALDL